MADEKLKEHTSENLGCRYLSFRDCFLTEDGVRITREEVDGKTQKFVRELYQKKKTNEAIFDYEYARTTGYIRKKKIDLPSPAITNPAVADFDEKIVPSSPFDPIKFIIAATVLIGFAMLIVSISYTHEHIARYTSPIVAWIFAIGLCSFNSIAFESSLLFWKMPKGKVLSVFFMLLFFVVLSFTLSANADVIYSKCRANQNTSKAESSSVSSASLVQSLTEQQAKDKKAEIESAQKAIDEYKAGEKVSSWRVSVMQTALDKKKAEYNTLIEEQKKNLKDNPTITKASEISSDSFYDFLGSKVGMKSGDVETLLNMLSILFVDIVAPASFAVALFLGGKNYGRKEESKDGEKIES